MFGQRSVPSINGGAAVKVADTVVSALIVNVQVVAVPEHAPPHEVKVEFRAGVSVKVTLLPASTREGQVSSSPHVIVPESAPPIMEVVMLYEVVEDVLVPELS